MSDTFNINDWFAPSEQTKDETQAKSANDGIFHISFSSDKLGATASQSAPSVNADSANFAPLKPDAQPSEPQKPVSSFYSAANMTETPTTTASLWNTANTPSSSNYGVSPSMPRASYEAPSVNVSAPVSSAPNTQMQREYVAPSFTMGAASTTQNTATAYAFKPETVQRPSTAPTYVEPPKQVVTPSYSDIRESYESDAHAPSVSSKNQLYQAPAMSVSSEHRAENAYVQPTMTVTPVAVSPVAAPSAVAPIEPEEVKSFFTPVPPKTEPQFVDCNVVVTKPKNEKKVKVKPVKQKKVKIVEEVEEEPKIQKAKKVKPEVDLDEKQQLALEKRRKPVGFFRMFFTEILYLIPVIGWLAMLITIVNPKCNKNIRSVAGTTLIWSLVIYGAVGLFAWYGGIGYILSFIEKTFNVIIGF